MSRRILDRILNLAGIIRTKSECFAHQAPPRLIFTLLGVTIALTGHTAAGERYTIVSVVTKGTSLKGETNNLNVNILYNIVYFKNRTTGFNFRGNIMTPELLVYKKTELFLSFSTTVLKI